MNISSEGTEEEEEISKMEFYFEGTILLCICLLAVAGNACMWLIICRSKELRTVTNYFILSLTVADLLVSMINMPVTVATLFLGGEWPLSEEACKLFGFLNMLTLVASVMSLCNISINRYVMVCKPIYFKRIYTNRNAAIMITVCFGTSFVISLPPLFGWAQYSFIRLQSFCFCDWTTAPSYAFFMIGACFGIPFTVMTICNVIIFRTVRASKRRLAPQNTLQATEVSKISTITEKPEDDSSHFTSNDKKQLTNSSTHDNRKRKIFNMNFFKRKEKPIETSNLESIEDGISESQVTNIPSTAEEKYGSGNSIANQKKRIRRGKARTEEIRLATSLAVIVVVFVICWLPYCCSMVLCIYGPHYVPRPFHMFTLLIGYANSCCNPIIYGIMNKKFGDGFRKLLCFWRQTTS